MSFNATSIIEVRTTGADTNGGGFSSAYGGTDYSQQDTAQATGTVTSSGTTVTATTGIFTSAMRGNFITDGTTWKQITAYTSSTVVTVDSAPSWTSASVSVGGGLATIAKGVALMTTNGMAVYVKAGTGYSISTGITFPSGPTYTASNRVIGYSTTRGDGGLATVTATAGITMFTLGQSGLSLENIDVNGGSVASTVGVNITATYSGMTKCKVRNCTGNGTLSAVGLGGSVCWCEQNEITGCSGGSGAINSQATQGGFVSNNWVHDNSIPGVIGSNSSVIVGNLCANNTGSSSDGIQVNYGAYLDRNVCYKNGRHGINVSTSYIMAIGRITNNILYLNSGYGLAVGPGPINTVSPYYHHNAFGSNTSGARSNLTADATDVTLTADPFVAAASNNFALNKTAGGGALLRGVGFPGTMPGGLTVGYQDIGIQHQDAGGGLIVSPSMCGVSE